MAKHGTSKDCCASIGYALLADQPLTPPHHCAAQCLASGGGERLYVLSISSAMPKPLTDDQIVALMALPYDSVKFSDDYEMDERPIVIKDCINT